jgi:hypothetical protein
MNIELNQPLVVFATSVLVLWFSVWVGFRSAATCCSATGREPLKPTQSCCWYYRLCCPSLSCSSRTLIARAAASFTLLRKIG